MSSPSTQGVPLISRTVLLAWVDQMINKHLDSQGFIGVLRCSAVTCRKYFRISFPKCGD